MDDETLAALRYCFQRVLVPCVVIIGVAGNLLTVVVLTRRRMRCSTNIYLTALAVADIVYLLFIFILSLQHYPNIHHPRNKIYWSTIGLSHWFCDASAVVILCFLLTVSTAFEYKLTQKPMYIHRNTGESCIRPTIVPFTPAMLNSTLNHNQMSIEPSTNNGTTTIIMKSNALAQPMALNGTQPISLLLPGDAMRNGNGNIWHDGIKEDTIGSHNNGTVNVITTTTTATDVLNDVSDNDTECQKMNYIYADQSDLGKNDLYKEIFYILTTTFATFIPLILLTTFNCFLVATVHRSHKIRHKMTNTRQADASTAQENKVTVTLIAVVILFLVCQTPSAIQLIYTMNATEHTNMTRAINNLVNFLVTVNAASNFLLYCALSDKYRKTVRSLLCGRKPVRTGILTSSRYNSGRTSTSFFSKSSNGNNFSNASTKTTGYSSTRGGKVKKRFSITQEEFANLREETERLKNPRASVTPTPEYRHNSMVSENFEEIPLQNLMDSSQQQLPCSHNTSSSRHLRPSGSELSLTRSRSLEFPSSPKHSPHCKDNPHHF